MCSMASSQLIFVHVCILLFQFVWSHVQYEPQEMLNDGFVAGDGGCILNNYNTCSCLRIGHTNVFRLGDPDSGVFFVALGGMLMGLWLRFHFVLALVLLSPRVGCCSSCRCCCLSSVAVVVVAAAAAADFQRHRNPAGYPEWPSPQCCQNWFAAECFHL